MIADYLRVGRLYLMLLAVFTLARVVQSATGVPYDKAHHVFSIVTLTFMAAAFYAAFCRRWRGYTGLQAMGLGLFFGVVAQVVIFAATVLSYALGAETFFNHPRALNVPAAIPLNDALLVRARGLVIGPIASARSRPGSAGRSAACCRSRACAPTSSPRPPRPPSAPPRALLVGNDSRTPLRDHADQRPVLAAGGRADRNAVVQLDPDHPGFPRRGVPRAPQRHRAARARLRPGTRGAGRAVHRRGGRAVGGRSSAALGPAHRAHACAEYRDAFDSLGLPAGPHPPAGGGVGEGGGRQRLPSGAGGGAGGTARVPRDAG